MKYISYSSKDTKLTIDYDLRNLSSFDSDKISSYDVDSDVSKIIKEMSFDVSDSTNCSGQFVGNYSSATSHFSSGYSALGLHFNKDFYIKIKNKTLSDRVGGTFVFSHTKKNRGTEIIFSNYNNSSSDPRGFEFGINDANKLFFECNSKDGPLVFSLNNIPFSKNIYYVEVDESIGSVALAWYDHSLERFERKSFSVDKNYLRPSQDWYIGTGVYQGEAGLNYSSSGFPYDGYLDRFMHFDGSVSDLEKKLIARTIYEEVEFVDETFKEIPGVITGSRAIESIVSGITGYVNVITGYTEQKTAQREYVTGKNLYGTVGSGEFIYEPFGDDIYDQDASLFRSITGVYRLTKVFSETYGITGFETGLHTETYSYGPERPLFYYSGISGELYKTYEYERLYGPSKLIRDTEAYYNISGEYPVTMKDGSVGYGPKSYTYLGARNPSKDFLETQKGVNMFSVNNFAGIFSSQDYENNVYISWNHDLTFDDSAISLLINGVTKQPGELIEQTSSDFTKYKALNQGEFAVDSSKNSQIVKKSSIYYDDENLSILVDSPVIDILKTGEDVQSLVVSNLSDYSSAPFSQIQPDGKNIFLNGQKLYENTDYTVIGQNFNPIGDCLNITGVYHTTNDWNYDPALPVQSKVSGLGAYDINESDVFSLDSFVSYMNGIRLDPKAFVYHDTNVDLINQGKAFIVENTMREVYNNVIRTEYSVGSEGLELTGIDYAISGEISADGKGVYDELHGVVLNGGAPSFTDHPEILNLEYEDI